MRGKGLVRRIRSALMGSPRALRRTMNLWAPHAGSGIRWTHVSEDWSYGRAELTVRPWNSNLHGVAYGGTLYSMGDALVGVLLARCLGPRYEAWTRQGTFQFLAPGQRGCFTEVKFEEDFLAWITETVAEDGYCNAPVTLTVFNPDGSVVGINQQDVHVRPRGGGPRVEQPQQAKQARGLVLESVATALVWHVFRERPEVLTALMSEQRRIADPREQMRHVVQACVAEGVSAAELLEFGVPAEFVGKQG